MPDASLEAKVLSELKMLRKNPKGVTVHTIAGAQVICLLLGSGDPYVAHSRLQHALLDATADRTVRAAAASLGFLSEGETHLDRLEDAGVDLGGIDQRQARRLSDKGLEVVAKLIATNWTVEAVPELTAVILGSQRATEVHLMCSRPHSIEMGEVEVSLSSGLELESLTCAWRMVDEGELLRTASARPVVISHQGQETSIHIVWRGELWPKFTTILRNVEREVQVESLGNKLAIHF